MDNNDFKQKGMTINKAAQKAGVSGATIRNWIKTGYLSQDNYGNIKEDSLQFFLTHIAGKEKLNSRANKSQKDIHNHAQLGRQILKKLAHDGSDSIGTEYENSLSDSYRNQEGIYYTPQSIIEDMVPLNINDIENKTFCDPSCGSGNFLIRALEIGFKVENVFGFDIDPIAIAITKKRIKSLTGSESNNIIQTNFLEFTGQQLLQFDYIFTNPPWGKKIKKQEKQKYGAFFNAGNSTDTSALFFFAALSCLNPEGKLGFLMPEAFFNIAAFEQVRKRALDLKIERLIDYGKSFKGLLTKAQAIILTNRKKQSCDIECRYNKKTYYRSAHSFSRIPKSILNFYSDNEAAKIIEHLYSIKHIRLLNNAEWGLGIVTGNNKRFSQNTLKNGYMPVYKGADISNKGLKKASVYIPLDLSLYQQVAPQELFESEEKLIYKFISSRLCFFHDTQKRYILNSANMLIPHKDFPVSCENLTALFNSDFMNWIFKNIFNTHKILRGDLEALPIHSDYFKDRAEFDEETYLDFLGLQKDKYGIYRLK